MYEIGLFKKLDFKSYIHYNQYYNNHNYLINSKIKNPKIFNKDFPNKRIIYNK